MYRTCSAKHSTEQVAHHLHGVEKYANRFCVLEHPLGCGLHRAVDYLNRRLAQGRNHPMLLRVVVIVLTAVKFLSPFRRQPLVLAPLPSPFVSLFTHAPSAPASPFGALREELAAHLVQYSSEEFGVFPHETFVDDVQDANADNDDDRGNSSVGHGLIIAG